ncbi:MAG: cytochrome P460 family protein [Proteobacteria bacterium]|nr:cytochrome P460 family protein [Pseudomonadota bacterium]
MAANRRSAVSFTAITVFLLALLVVAGVAVDGRVASSQQDSATVTTPKNHFKVERPADMFPNTAETVYQNIRAEMAAGYALARMPDLRNYLSWRRFNKAPYRSATHGARYVNNYANRAGQAYGAFEQADILPKGSILLKDSFTATADGGIYPGPMFVMEKMDVGFNPKSGDWRYSMIMPDGSLFGETKGVSAEAVQFCIGCHATRQQYDHLFFLPEEFRLTPIEADQ